MILKALGIGLLIFILTNVLLYLFVLYQYHLSFTTNEAEYLIPEQYITDPEVYADQIIQEAQRIFNVNPFWASSYQLEVSSKRVEGPYAAYNMSLQRASAVISLPNETSTIITARDLFHYLTTPEGFTIIDPYSDPKDFNKTLEVYPLSSKEGNGRLEAATATSGEMEFVVFNCIAEDSMIFISKSILHPLKPGGSITAPVVQEQVEEGIEAEKTVKTENETETTEEEADKPAKKTRAINCFAVQIIPLPIANAPHQVKILVYNYLGTPTVPGPLLYSIVAYGYMGPFLDRLMEQLPQIGSDGVRGDETVKQEMEMMEKIEEMIISQLADSLGGANEGKDDDNDDKFLSNKQEAAIFEKEAEAGSAIVAEHSASKEEADNGQLKQDQTQPEQQAQQQKEEQQVIADDDTDESSSSSSQEEGAELELATAALDDDQEVPKAAFVAPILPFITTKTSMADDLQDDLVKASIETGTMKTVEEDDEVEQTAIDVKKEGEEL